jgi:hypothetical protein
MIPLPHRHHDWTPTEYVRWLNEHGEQDRVGIIERVVKDWEESRGGDGGLNQEEKRWRDMVKTVLDRTK